MAASLSRAAWTLAGAVADQSARRRVVGSTRTRLTTTYLVLLVGAGAVSMIGIHSALVYRLEQRTDAALRQELLELDVFVDEGIDPQTGDPFASLDRAFSVYLERNIPSPEEAFIALIGGAVVRDLLRSFPGREIPAEAVASWAAFATRGTGPAEIDGEFETPLGSARFRAARVTVGDQTGAFVVTILPVAGRREIRELQTTGTAILVTVVLIAGACAWFLAGRVLRPVRDLTATARAITERDLAARVPVVGTSETAEMARTFNEMLDRLDAAYASQLEFLQAAGHELRAPLTVAVGHLELSVDADEVERAETLALVLDELGRMGRIIDDLQSLAFAERPDFLVVEPIEGAAFARELLAKASAMAPRQLVLGTVVGGPFGADRDRLTEAMLNLVDNAIKNTTADDRITIDVIVADDIRLTVADTGVGIAPEEVDTVFTRFMRGSGAHRRYRGAGLGLPIVQSIAAAHGGRVELASTVGLGTTVSIVIPSASSATAVIAADRQELEV